MVSSEETWCSMDCISAHISVQVFDRMRHVLSNLPGLNVDEQRSTSLGSSLEVFEIDQMKLKVKVDAC